MILRLILCVAMMAEMHQDLCKTNRRHIYPLNVSKSQQLISQCYRLDIRSVPGGSLQNQYQLRLYTKSRISQLKIIA